MGLPERRSELGRLVGPAVLTLACAFGLAGQAIAADPPILRYEGELTTRPAGMPVSPDPGRQLESASVVQDIEKKRVTGTFALRGAPSAAAASELHVSFGTLEGTTCQATEAASTPVPGPSAPGFSLSGNRITLEGANLPWYGDWNCAFAALTAPGQAPTPATTFDVLIGEMKPVHAQPEVRIDSIELLRKKAKKLRLVPGVPTRVVVNLANAGRAAATNVPVRGAGRGIKAKGETVTQVYAESEGSADLIVTLKRRRKATLKVTAIAGGAKVTRKVPVLPAKRPRPPLPGAYEDAGANVDFQIKRGRVVGFRIYTQTRCGTYPDFPTYTMNTYDFPTVRIAGNGIVDAVDRGELYTARLQLRVSGGKVRDGYFSYAGPASCFASDDFAPKLSRR